jgi:asparagine synthase (glutamine-hydrolysing)
MCRIAGIINTNHNIQNIHTQIKGMCTAMALAGPDDEGFEFIENGMFGHRRLALIDLSSAGHQPMQYKHLTLTYNGEIYNYLELKSKLINEGYNFYTQSDTEVILAGFLAWGTSLFKQLEGMFAFALYDDNLKQTFLVRDEMGIKPLYYSTENNSLTFASEIKAFKTLNSFEEDKNWKVYFLAFGHIPHPFSTLKNVFSLENGSYLKWDNCSGAYSISNFSESPSLKTIITKQGAEKTIRQDLENAVEKHLIADAPIGVFLSGGIDSSLITLLADQKININLKALSINFEEQAFSEGKYQQIIADKIEGEHQSFLIKQEEFDQEIDSILNAMDQPTSDGINSWFVCKKAKESGLKAVLSGIGADELLGGYPSFNRMGFIVALKKLPKFILRLSNYLPLDKLNRTYYLSLKNPIGEYLFLRGFFTPKTISKLLEIPIKNIETLLENFPIDKNIYNLLDKERVAYLETNYFMKNQLLKDTDFMSMSHGLEVRVPFLDQQFVKNLNHTANNIRFTNLPKGLLINAFKNILPEAIWNRPKMGFTFPLQQWFIKSGYLNSATYNTEATLLMDKFNNGKLHWSKAFALYQVFKNK